MKNFALVLFSLLAGGSVSLVAQTCSSTAVTNELVCAGPQLFGPGGLILPNTAHSAHFQKSTLATFGALDTSIGEALSTLPLGTAGSGYGVTYDQNHIPTPTEDSLGPILTERAGVIGRGKFNVGVAYQYFNFTKIDGVHLNNFQAVETHAKFLPKGTTTYPDYEGDYITTNNDVSLNLNQTVLYGVFGITSHLDGSVEIPIESVHFRITSAAHIVRTVACEQTATCTTEGEQCGLFHWFGPKATPSTNPTNCPTVDAATNIDHTFTNGGNASGLGDVILRAKYEVWPGEKIRASLGLTYRLPSGDEKNFLGSGTTGLEPFAALTYRARLSPHVRLGYQWNGRSILAGDPTSTDPAAAKHHLPPELLYSAGADYGMTKRITAAVDLIGGRVLDADRLSVASQFTIPATGKVEQGQDLTNYFNDYSTNAISTGAKVLLPHRLVLIGNLTTRLDTGGLVARVVPLVGLSYAF